MSFAATREKELRSAALKRGAEVLDRGNGHFQIRGNLLVNYYPFSKSCTAYVAATSRGDKHVSPAEAVAMAFEAPPIATDAGKKKTKRRGKSTRARRLRLIKARGPNCHWCKACLTIDESTLDHVIPLSRGGLDNSNNVVLACESCNKGRGNAMPELAK